MRSWIVRAVRRGGATNGGRRPGKFLLRHGLIYTTGVQCTQRHRVWLNWQRFEEPATQRTLEHNGASIDVRLAELLALAQTGPFRGGVARVSALRRIGPLSALILLADRVQR